MKTAVLTPTILSGAGMTVGDQRHGHGKRVLWRKEILPSGTRSYQGQTLDFATINPACYAAFKDKAFDAVPFVMALPDNRHPEPGQEAELIEGDLEDVELSEDGRLFGLFNFQHSERMRSILAKTDGKFGVSCQIEVDYVDKAARKKFDFALSHVCGTLRPHVKGMAPWERVELSQDASLQKIDLSDEVIESGKPEPQSEGDESRVKVEMSVSQWQLFMEFLTAFRDTKPDEGSPTGGEESVSMTDRVAQDRYVVDLAEGDAPWFNVSQREASPTSGPHRADDPTGLQDIVDANEARKRENHRELYEIRASVKGDPAYQAFQAQCLENWGYRH